MYSKRRAGFILIICMMAVIALGICACAEETNIGVQRVDFYKDGSSVCAKADIILEKTESVTVWAAVYDDSGCMVRCSYNMEQMPEGAGWIYSEPLEAPSDTELLRIFVWDRNCVPMGAAYTREAEPEFEVSAVVYGDIYAGSVNTVRKTITFDVPKSISGDNGKGISLAKGNGFVVPGSSHVSGTYTMAFDGALASIDGEPVTENTKISMNSDTEIDVTVNGKKELYTAEVNISEKVASNNFERAVKITESSNATLWANDKRKNLPDSTGAIGTTSIYGLGQFVKNGSQYDFENAPGNYDLVTDSQTGKALKITKKGAGEFLTYAISGIYEPEKVDKLVAEYKIKLLSADSNKEIAELYTSDLMNTVITTEGMAEGKYTLRIYDSKRGCTVMACRAPEMEFGNWYTIKFIYRKDAAASENGYVCELYVDDRFVAEFCGGSGITGKLNNTMNYPQFMINSFEDAKYDMLLDDYQISVVRGRENMYVEKLPDGKTSAYTFTADDGYKASAKWYYEKLKQYGLKGSLAIMADRAKGATNTGKFASYELLNSLTADGVLNVGNHSATHKTLTQATDDELEAEVNGAQQTIRENMPNQKVLTMYLPSNQKNDTVMAKISENHYATRYTGAGQPNLLYLSDAELQTTKFYTVLGTGGTTPATTIDTMNGWIDKGISEGRWIIEMWHEVSGDDVDGAPSGNLPYYVDSSIADRHFAYVSKHSDEVYTGTYEDMVCYIMERSHLRCEEISLTENRRVYNITYDSAMLKKAEDARYFDVPVTINMIIPSDWTDVYVKQGDREEKLVIYEEQTPVIGREKRMYVIFDVVPGGGEVVIGNGLASSKKEITSAQITVGGYTYKGLINSQTNEITFEIPYSTVKDETTQAAKGLKSPGIIRDMSAVEYSVGGYGVATANGKVIKPGNTFDADTVNEIVVTAEDESRRVYNVKYDYMTVLRRYNANGAYIRPDTENSWSLRGAPSQITAWNIYDGNCGDSTWRIEGVKYNSSGELAGGPFGAFTIESHNNKPGDNYIKIDKKGTPSSGVFRLYSQANYGNNSDVIRTQLRFNLNSFTNRNTALLHMWTADCDQLLLSSKNAAEGKFRIWHRALNTDEPVLLDGCPELEVGKWYTLTTVFRKGEEYPKGYIIEVYLAEDEGSSYYIGSIANKSTVPTGNMNAPANAWRNIEFSINSWSTSVYELYIDDYEIMTSDNAGNYDSTVYLLGDSICRYYADDKAPQQGWGKYFYNVFNENTRVLNYSVGGYNTNIYLNGAKRPTLKSEPIWPSIKRQIKPGDYVVIALGWNEGNKVDGTTIDENFRKNIEVLANDCKALGVTPIFVTATPNLKTSVDGSGNTIYGEPANTPLTGLTSAREDGSASGTVHPVTVMKEFAAENGYICLDLNAEAFNAINAMEQQEYHEFFTGSCSDSGAPINSDHLHITERGAKFMCDLLVKLLRESDCDLKNRLAE